ncbi:hypothetical protein P154DRAFT_21663 [Amniculicola lignicola CBS 123094]|uniref:Uncharacterized protein n=1 Tax=Amniculicola lignicola CBS 123094 TaxID=1392246 RepID=A0A6A5WUW9_9PLEO|nr:hypothetical protein P154DRAFT_21663 [Amniculicola lignicola CBS 123094]
MMSLTTHRSRFCTTTIVDSLRILCSSSFRVILRLSNSIGVPVARGICVRILCYDTFETQRGLLTANVSKVGNIFSCFLFLTYCTTSEGISAELCTVLGLVPCCFLVFLFIRSTAWVLGGLVPE